LLTGGPRFTGVVISEITQSITSGSLESMSLKV
jgi:hypothetical protein